MDEYVAELFPEEAMADADMAILQQMFSHPAVINYCRSLGRNLVRSFLLDDTEALTPAVAQLKREFLQGQLSVLDALCKVSQIAKDTN